MSPQEIFESAKSAAQEASRNCAPHPVIFGTAKSLFSNEIVPGSESYCSEGLCGFAWVTIKPARGEFVKFLKNNKIGSNGYYGGWEIWMGNEFAGMTQSMERKEAASYAFAKVLRQNGINCSIGSRLD